MCEVFWFNSGMLKTPTPFQHELEMVTLEQLVPKGLYLSL